MLALILSFSVSVHEDWFVQESEDKEFSLLVPHKLNKYSKKTLSEVGELTLISYQSDKADSYQNHYSLSYIDYPEDSFEMDDSLRIELARTTVEGLPGDTVYEELSKGSAYYTVLSRKKLEEQNLYSKSKVFVVGYRVYIMMVYAPNDRAINNGIDLFLDSFKLL